MLRIEVKSMEVQQREKVNGRTFDKFVVREQVAHSFMYDRHGQEQEFTTPIVLKLAPGQSPYPLGCYVLSGSSIYVNRFNQLEINPVLSPSSTGQLEAA